MSCCYAHDTKSYMNNQTGNVTAITGSQSLVLSIATVTYLWKFNSFCYVYMLVLSDWWPPKVSVFICCHSISPFWRLEVQGQYPRSKKSGGWFLPRTEGRSVPGLTPWFTGGQLHVHMAFSLYDCLYPNFLFIKDLIKDFFLLKDHPTPAGLSRN